MWIRVNKSTGIVYVDETQSPTTSVISHSFWIECLIDDIPDINGLGDEIVFALNIALSLGELTEDNVIKQLLDGTFLNKLTVEEVANLAEQNAIVEPEKVVISEFRDLEGHVFWKKGFKYIAPAGQTTSFSEKFNTTLLLSGGGYRVCGNAELNDNLTLEVADNDNIFGYGAGVVLASFISTDFVWPEKVYNILTEDAKPIYAGLYFKFTYVSTGVTDVDISAWYNLRLA